MVVVVATIVVELVSVVVVAVVESVVVAVVALIKLVILCIYRKLLTVCPKIIYVCDTNFKA